MNLEVERRLAKVEKDLDKQELEAQEQEDLCCICLDETANQRLVPCGHKVCCSQEECEKMVVKHKRCPLCRKRFEKILMELPDWLSSSLPGRRHSAPEATRRRSSSPFVNLKPKKLNELTPQSIRAMWSTENRIREVFMLQQEQNKQQQTWEGVQTSTKETNRQLLEFVAQVPETPKLLAGTPQNDTRRVTCFPLRKTQWKMFWYRRPRRRLSL